MAKQKEVNDAASTNLATSGAADGAAPETATAPEKAKRGRKPGSTTTPPVYWTEAMEEELVAHILAGDATSPDALVAALKADPAFSAVNPDLLTTSVVANHLRNMVKNAKSPWAQVKDQLKIQRGGRRNHAAVFARLQARFPGKLVPAATAPVTDVQSGA